MAKKYKVKAGEDLGVIAKKFGLPSWKYLYLINRKTIGDNPDILKAGTELTIPLWDSTSGDEKIREKGADPFNYTGGLRYKYPWVPFSMTRTMEDGNPENDFKEEREFRMWNTKTGNVLIQKNIKKADEISVLIPDIPDFEFGIKGYPVKWNGKMHYHPDDIVVGIDKTDTSKETDY